MMGRAKSEICMRMRDFMVLAIFAASTCWGFTDPRDVYAINSIYASLGFPLLPGWVPFGGDPCDEHWQGVLCVNANITGIVLNDSNLGGELSEDLGSFASIIQIDFSNNHIGGSIPSNLPSTVKTFFLSGNQFTGSIPDSLSTLGQLSDFSLSNNNLTGAIPDAFQQLKSLINLDLSGNNLSGQLPPSIGNLSSLTTLHLQNNQLSGFLDVLQDLPLTDLNIENNLFSGPIPDKLQSIPNFRKAGNPFNTTIIPSPPASSPSPSSSSPSPSPFGVPPPQLVPHRVEATGPSAQLQIGQTHNGSRSTRWIVIAGLVIVVLLLLGLCVYMSRYCKKGQSSNKEHNRHDISAYNLPRENPMYDQSLQKPDYRADKVVKPVTKDQGNNSSVTMPETTWTKYSKRKPSWSEKDDDHQLDMTAVDILPPPPPPFLTLPAERMILDANLPPITTRKLACMNLSSEKCYTVAALQQYTNSFSQDNLIGGGMLGRVFKAELPGGKLLAIKKLDTALASCQSDQDFVHLISTMSRLEHESIVRLVGYCVEHGQRLLVYEYYNNGTLYEALHVDEEMHRQLSWNVRVRIALQAARALEYMHEVCHPPVLHRNFRSANVLLDKELTVHVSDCSLATLVPSKSMAMLQRCGYGAPELELGSYTYQSDVYSFGVVLLELLTGRKSYDRSRPRGEQFLVRWAVSQLHDIDALSRMVDPSLAGAYPSKSLSRFADIISLCIQPEPEFRPPMSEIVQNLLHMM
ncbi:protein STRUBBELIG-RECEPTOR FAMILY 3-like [Ipomoea triloba]|uniref:protein STRUBBELIG-RECEPTOR FAMILY 3-like n=1 Tax=Ipomoea triloba TaxID=35885 RepID=UPI00125E43B7|nr:protein STRUBBELIG-RECEPTOR FAMILY 3-like [Ipomoea triloba]XP_031129096.1 protein STRUBBELIG-RECEPTOR FAMILY 3-like [Ipomoea triloba]XP_031129097.1 protein STRUBBELIG-RECEPTOR FAMILY 3-like [Ipomoea triloba]